MKSRHLFWIVMIALLIGILPLIACGDDDDDDDSDDDDDDDSADDDDGQSGDNDDDDAVPQPVDGTDVQCDVGIEAADVCGETVSGASSIQDAKQMCSAGDPEAYAVAYCGLTHPYVCADLTQCISDVQNNPDPNCIGSLTLSGEVAMSVTQGALTFSLGFYGQHNGQTTLFFGDFPAEPSGVTPFSFSVWKCTGEAGFWVYNAANGNGNIEQSEPISGSPQFDINSQDIDGINF